jgi:hypothetical protein
MAFSAKQKMYSFSKTKKRKAKKIRTVVGKVVKNPVRRPIVRKAPVAREIVIVEQSKQKGAKMAKSTKQRKTRRKSTVKSVRKTARRRRRTAVVAKRTIRKSRRTVRHVARRAHRGMMKYSGGVITSNKKESLINIACIGAGFIGSMALINLAPLPASIKSAKWKGGALAAASILLSLKVKDKKAKLALVGVAVYGVVDILKNYIPQLAALSGYDAQKALILSGAVQSRSRQSVGGSSSNGRTFAVGAGRGVTAPAPVRSHGAMVLSSSHYHDTTAPTSSYVR